MKTSIPHILVLVALWIPACLGAQTKMLKTNEPLLRVSYTEEGIQLTWTTAREVNSRYFLVESSTDSSHFCIIKDIPACGSSIFAKTYEDTESLADTTRYFRVTLVDMNGTWFSSSVVVVYSSPARAVSIK